MSKNTTFLFQIMGKLYQTQKVEVRHALAYKLQFNRLMK